MGKEFNRVPFSETQAGKIDRPTGKPNYCGRKNPEIPPVNHLEALQKFSREHPVMAAVLVGTVLAGGLVPFANLMPPENSRGTANQADASDRLMPFPDSLVMSHAVQEKPAINSSAPRVDSPQRNKIPLAENDQEKGCPHEGKAAETGSSGLTKLIQEQGEPSGFPPGLDPRHPENYQVSKPISDWLPFLGHALYQVGPFCTCYATAASLTAKRAERFGLHPADGQRVNPDFFCSQVAPTCGAGMPFNGALHLAQEATDLDGRITVMEPMPGLLTYAQWNMPSCEGYYPPEDLREAADRGRIENWGTFNIKSLITFWGIPTETVRSILERMISDPQIGPLMIAGFKDKRWNNWEAMQQCKAWDLPPDQWEPGHEGHAMVLVGIEYDEEGKAWYLIRDSRGQNFPYIGCNGIQKIEEKVFLDTIHLGGWSKLPEDLQITFSPKLEYQPGEQITYTMTISNPNGHTLAKGIEIGVITTGTVPASLSCPENSCAIGPNGFALSVSLLPTKTATSVVFSLLHPDRRALLGLPGENIGLGVEAKVEASSNDYVLGKTKISLKVGDMLYRVFLPLVIGNRP